MVTFINDLPNEVLADIMRHLNQQALREGVLTCQKWKNVIECNCSWSVTLLGYFMQYLNLETLISTTRKVRKLHFGNHGSGSWLEQNLPLFLRLLNSLPYLEEVSLQDVELLQTPENCDLPDLEKLKTLKLMECHGNILQCFRKSRLESLAIQFNIVRAMPIEPNAIDFVRGQPNLTDLHLMDFRDTFFQQLCDTTPNGLPQFKLTQLIIEHFYIQYATGLVNFFETHCEKLRKLKLEGRFPRQIFELIFGKLKSLKFLTLSLYDEVTEAHEELERNPSIENLVLNCNHISPLAMRQLCDSSPNVKTFTWGSYFNRVDIPTIARKLRKVTKLFFYNFDGNFNSVTFPNLTSLYIVQISGIVDWDAFTMTNSKITEIIVFHVKDSALSHTHLETIIRNLNLRKLKIFSGISADEDALSTIRKSRPDLKVLELPESHVIIDLPHSYHEAAKMMKLNITFF